MKTTTYRISINGKIIEKNQYPSTIDALIAADNIRKDQPKRRRTEISVFGYSTYSDDDNTQMAARTYMFLDCKLDKDGKIVKC